MKTFEVLITGWVLDLRRHTVTEVVRAAGAVGYKHISSFHRFFSRARWTTDDVGLKLAALIIEQLLPTGTIRLVVDDTLSRHTGNCIAAASMHRDPLLSTGRRPFFHWGHVWVIATRAEKTFETPRGLRCQCSLTLCTPALDPVSFSIGHRPQRFARGAVAPFTVVTLA